MKQAVLRRKSYRGVIVQLEDILKNSKLSEEARKHHAYLLSRANGAERKRARARRAHRHMVSASRRANRS